jgi:hypothetical protein
MVGKMETARSAASPRLLDRIGLRVLRWLVRRGPYTRQVIHEIISYQREEEHDQATAWAKKAAEHARGEKIT